MASHLRTSPRGRWSLARVAALFVVAVVGTLGGQISAAAALPTLSPSHGTSPCATPLTIYDSRASEITVVKVGRSDAAIGMRSANSVTVICPQGNFPGPVVLIGVAYGDGTVVSATFFVDAPASPGISSLAPNLGPLAGGNTVRITGTQLADATKVTFGGKDATIASRSATEVSVTAPAGVSVDPPVDVIVTTPSGSTNALKYTYEVPPPHTSLSAISPDHGAARGGEAVRLTGTNLTLATKVTFGSNEATITAKSATSLDVLTPSGYAGASVDVVVATAHGTTTAVKYHYDAPQPETRAYDLSGSATLKSLVRGTFAVGGAADLTFDDEGVVQGPIALKDASARLIGLGLIPMTAKLGFNPAGNATGTLDDAGGLTLAYRARIQVKELKLFGTVALAIGTSCQTRSAATIPLSASTFDPALGGTLLGTFTLSNLSGCGALNGLVSPLTSGSGNLISVKLAPRANATP